MIFRTIQNIQLVFILLLNISIGALAGPAWSHAEYGAGNYGSEYSILYRTLDDIIAQRGRHARGVFYINDINAEWVGNALFSLRQYAVKKGYLEIEFKPLIGDYNTISLPVTDTAHLKHPEPSMIEKIDLQRLANHSRSGLEVTTFSPYDLNTAIHDRAILNVKSLGRGYEYKPPPGFLSGGPLSTEPMKFRINPNCSGLFLLMKDAKSDR